MTEVTESHAAAPPASSAGGSGIFFGALSAVFLFALLLLGAFALFLTSYILSQWDDPHGLVTDFSDHLADAMDDRGMFYAPLDTEDPLLLLREVHLYSDVGASSAARTVAALRYLNAVDPAEPITLYITTWGGWSSHAFAVIDTMGQIEARVNTIALGMANSAGAMILVSGTGTRYATPNAHIMVHANDSESDDELSRAYLDRELNERLWRTHANLPEDWFPMVYDLEYHLTAEKALEYGVIDEILEPAEEEAE